jgi:uncharacterized protein
VTNPPAFALRVTVRLDESGPPTPNELSAAIVERAHAAGLTAVTVYPRATSAEDDGNRVISLEPALNVTLIDSDERIRAFLPQLTELVGADAITLDPLNERYELIDRK